ncbi:MAG: S41 family peptidase, partial [Clostridia bacterium]
ELAAFADSLHAAYVGIGISVHRVRGAVEIESVFADSPAAVAGLLAGDRILQVDGQDVTNCTVAELVNLVRGEAGTTVQLTVERNGAAINATVSRAAVNQTTVSYAALEDGLGYLYISIFNNSTPAEIQEADAFFREQGIKKLVIDLRDNPGGELIGVVGALGYFVPQGKTVVSIEYNDKSRNTSLRSVGDVKGKPYYELAVLVNGGTASAAELFAGNIRDHGLGKLVGSKTFGKGTVQEFMRLFSTESLPMGSIKVTAAEYVLPGGDKVNGVGIRPDYWVSNRTILLNTEDMEPMEFGPDFKEGDTGTAILALKQRFDALGYYVGEVDDQYDRELTLAVRELQAQAGLPVTGVMDMDTQTLFSNVVGEARVLCDDQFDRAVELLQTGK